LSETALNNWQAVHDEVLRRIHARIWKPGEMIPGEAELACEFGCARSTVNRALRMLADSGLLDRRRRAGTRVALHPVRKATLDISITRHDVEARGERYGYSLLDREEGPPPPDIRARLDLPADTRMLHVRAVHLANGRPHMFEDRWLHLAATPDILKADLAKISANEWLVVNAPFTRGDFTFTASNAGDEEARILGTSPGQALFIIERTTFDGPCPITFVRLAFAPGYRMHTSL